MAKIRIYELTKDMEASAKVLITKLKDLGVDAANHMTAIDVEDAERLKKYLKTGIIDEVKKPAPKIVEQPTVVKSAVSKSTSKVKAKTVDNEKKVEKQEKPVAAVMQTEQVADIQADKTVKKIRTKKSVETEILKADKDKAPETKPVVEKPQEIKKTEVKVTENIKQEINAAEIKNPDEKSIEVKKQAEKPVVEKRRDDGKPMAERTQNDRPIGERRREDNRPMGERRPNDNRPMGERRPSDNKPMGERRPNDNRPMGERRPGDNRPMGERRPNDNRPMGERRSGDNRPMGERRPGDNRPMGERRPGDNRPSDTKLRTEKPAEIRPRKKSPEKQREQEIEVKPKKKNGDLLPQINDEAAVKIKKKKPADTKLAAKDLNPPVIKAEDKKSKKNRKEEEVVEEIKILSVPKNIPITEFASMLKMSATELVKELFLKKNMMVNMNQDITYAVASEIAEEHGLITEEADEIDILEKFFTDEEDDETETDKVERPPVVVVMGHVDHGKTSLLDAIRHSNVTGGEAGGITQHIGAYTVSVNGRAVTFLDTPGHEAFTAMRMRGAQVTDVAVLVVAADDGVMPQTVEAINHAKAAGVDIIVAINKIDKPSANPDRVKQELTEHGILVEDWGGDTISVPVSAINREGLDTLLEMILLASDMKELKANPKKRARGTVIEAALDKGRGPVATILIQDGTISVGDPVVAGSTYGKIRAMMDDKGNKVKQAGPSMPVEILGLSEAPQAGDLFFVAKSEKQARQLSESVVAKGRQDMLKETPQKVSLDDLFSQIQLGEVKDLNIVVKADVQGSVEAVKNSLEKLSNDEVRIRTIHGGVGAVTESDVMLASASNAIIIGFNVRPEPLAKSIAETEKVDIRLYRIIYNAIEDITAAMKGMLDPIYEEKVIGQAQIRQLFRASGIGTIGGSYVTSGKITRQAKVRILRDNKVVYEGSLDALKRFKDDVKEVLTGYECGLTFSKFNDIKEGDIVEAFIMEEIPR